MRISFSDAVSMKSIRYEVFNKLRRSTDRVGSRTAFKKPASEHFRESRRGRADEFRGSAGENFKILFGKATWGRRFTQDLAEQLPSGARA